MAHSRQSSVPLWKPAALVFVAALIAACGRLHPNAAPSIEFSRIPRSDDGGTESRAIIEGLVEGARPGERIVLFAKSGTGLWWVQPFADQPYTDIRSDRHWENFTHLGTEYAAVLVGPDYQPPQTTGRLPSTSRDVIAVASAKGEVERLTVSRTLHFSGYEWEIRGDPSNRGGARNNYDPANAWTDVDGRLHLRIAKGSGEWTCAEVTLTRSLGYGSYSIDVQDVSSLEPSAVLGFFTWDDSTTDVNHRELDTEISRWGDPAGKNLQYVVQPYYIPANVVRFSAPAGKLRYSFDWKPGSVTYKTIRMASGAPVAEHTFTSGVPLPGGEAVHMNLYPFANKNSPLQHPVEVVIDKFEYLP